MVPIDPLLGSQWHFSSLGFYNSEILIHRIWNEYNGTGVYVGIYDDGIETQHFDLDNNYDASRHIVFNGLTLPSIPLATDAHGTSVAGLIAAENNGLDSVGVAFGARITGVNIFDPSSIIFASGVDPQISANFVAALALGYNFDVVNHSWGTAPSFDSVQNLTEPAAEASRIVDAYQQLATIGRNGLGTVVVQAAGNEFSDANGDGVNASRFTITVGGHHNDGYSSSYSNYGPSLLVSSAAGDDPAIRNSLGIVTTDRSGTFGYNFRSNVNGNSTYTDDFGGTSAATPLVSGVVALMLDANPNLGWRDVQEILAVSADHTGSSIGSGPLNNEHYAWLINGARNVNGGGLHYSGDYGFGRVNAFSAVRMAEAWTNFEVPQTSLNEKVVAPDTFQVNQLLFDNSVSTFSFEITETLNIEHVDLSVQLTHSFFNDLRITLISPYGTEVLLLDGLQGNEFTANSGFSWTFGVETFRNELVTGTWVVEVADVELFDEGFWGSIDFKAYGSEPTIDDVYHFTNEIFATILSAPSRTLLEDTNGGQDWIDGAALIDDIVLNLNSGGEASAGTIEILNIGIGTQIENAILGDGNDVIFGNESSNSLLGSRGSDLISGGIGGDSLDGGDGVDTLSYASSVLGVAVSLLNHTASGGDAQGDQIFNFENVLGSGVGDNLTGSGGSNRLEGGAGADTLDGLGGSDFLFGGEGDDTIYFDALDLNANVNGGNGTDTLRVVDGALPTGFNLVASEFEKAEWLQTDTLGQSFAKKTGRYDSAWQITSESIIFDAGTSRELLFDYTAPIIYKSQQYDYSTTGLLTYHYTVFDNDASRDTTYDNTPGIAWQSQRNDYEASGFRTYIYFVFDDNASRDTTFDNNTPGIAWQSQRNDYDATGFRTYNYFVFDDSSSRDTTFDNTAPIAWKSQSNDYDAFNFKTLNTLIFDDNTSRYTSFDNTVGTVWKSLRQDYDATGALTYQFYVFDNDTSRQVVYDVANNQPWTTATTNYDAAGNVVEYFVV